jgi:thiamine-phosphate pyrophosphorylase
VNEGPRALALADAALDAGVRIIQYRAKRGIDETRLGKLREMTRNALLILDDDWRAAQAFGCDGAHLGPGDDGFDDPHRLRRSWPQGIVGISCADEREARAAESGDADYLGAGSVYATLSKDDAGAPIGIDGLRRIVAATRLPVAAIGGIGAADVAEVRRSGAAMAAVISAVSAASDPRSAARALVDRWSSTGGSQ